MPREKGRRGRVGWHEVVFGARKEGMGRVVREMELSRAR